MMKNRILFRILVVVVLNIVGCGLFTIKDRPAAGEYVIVRTDKTEYKYGEPMLVTIQNKQSREVSIYTPFGCVLTNSSTTIEKYENDEWKLWKLFCADFIFTPELLSSSKIRTSVTDDSIPKHVHFFFKDINLLLHHVLPPKYSLHLKIQKLWGKLNKETKARIVYYLGEGKSPIYSNEFIINADTTDS